MWKVVANGYNVYRSLKCQKKISEVIVKLKAVQLEKKCHM